MRKSSVKSIEPAKKRGRALKPAPPVRKRPKPAQPAKKRGRALKPAPPAKKRGRAAPPVRKRPKPAPPAKKRGRALKPAQPAKKRGRVLKPAPPAKKSGRAAPPVRKRPKPAPPAKKRGRALKPAQPAKKRGRALKPAPLVRKRPKPAPPAKKRGRALKPAPPVRKPKPAVPAKKRGRVLQITGPGAKELEAPGRRPPPLLSKRESSKLRLSMAADRLRRAAESMVPAEVRAQLSNVQHLLVEAEVERRREESEEKNRHLKLRAWLNKKSRPRPSKRAEGWFRGAGEWRKNADGTETGFVQLRVPAEATGNWESFDDWLSAWGENFAWLDEEPLWLGIGLSISGVDREMRDRYDRIRGRVAIASYWYQARGMGATKGFQYLLGGLRDEVAQRVMDKGLSIFAVTIFGHYGPVKPRGVIQ